MEGLGLENILEGLGLVSDLKSKVSVSDCSVSFTFLAYSATALNACASLKQGGLKLLLKIFGCLC